MNNVLIVSSGEKGRVLFSELLKACDFSAMMVVTSGAEARRALIENSFEMVVINAPLTDEFGHELALRAAENDFSAVLLIAKADISDNVAQRVEDSGVLVVEKPLNRPLFFQSVKMARAMRRRMLGLQNENVRLQQKIEEIRLVDRAKCALIQYLGMTESQAHRYIEKQAMDMRQSRYEIAQEILKTYES